VEKLSIKKIEGVKSPYKMTWEEFSSYKPAKPDRGYRLVYHQTNNKAAFNIAKEGIKLSRSKGKSVGEPTVIWGYTEKEGFYGGGGDAAIVVFQVPLEDIYVEIRNNIVMVYRDVDLKDVLEIDPYYSTKYGAMNLSRFRSGDYARKYYDLEFSK